MILPEVSRREWMEDAACVGIPTEMFVLHTAALDADAADKIAAAKRVCAVCPVKRECLEYAYEVEDRAGILGGTTPRERATIRVRKNKYKKETA